MSLKERLEKDLVIYKTESERLYRLLVDLFKTIKKKRLNNDELILAYMENIIEKNGQKIIKSIDNEKFIDVEQLFFEQTVYNTYVSEFKYREYRPIYYKTMTDSRYMDEWKTNEKALIFESQKKK